MEVRRAADAELNMEHVAVLATVLTLQSGEPHHPFPLGHVRSDSSFGSGDEGDPEPEPPALLAVVEITEVSLVRFSGRVPLEISGVALLLPTTPLRKVGCLSCSACHAIDAQPRDPGGAKARLCCFVPHSRVPVGQSWK